MSPSPDHTIEFGWFGELVRVRSADEATAALFRRLWGDSPVPAAPRVTHSYTISVGSGIPPSIRGPFGTRPLDPRFALWHAYNLVLRELAGSLGSRFLLHAASIARDGRAMVLAGPSGFGKTTLSLHLSFRGFTLLSDDTTALFRGAAEIEALPRAVHLRIGSREALSPSEIERISRAALHHDDEGWTVGAGFLGEPGPEPVPLRTLVILRGREPVEPGPRDRVFDLWTVKGFDDLAVEMLRIPGVLEVGPSPDGVGAIRVRARPIRPLSAWIRDHEPEVLAAAEVPFERPDFNSSPSCRTLRPFEAAIDLCRGLLNRHSGSALDREFRKREALLVAEIAESLRGVSLLSLSPGRIEETSALLRLAFETGSVPGSD